MHIRRWLLRYIAVTLVFGTVSPARHFPGGSEIALAQTSLLVSQEKISELEASLFVQDPHLESGKKAIQLIWIPLPIQKYCLGKTSKECSTIDYCIRTTNKRASMCQNLSVDTTRLSAYPQDVPPRRVLSIVYFLPIATADGFDTLAKFFENAPKGSLDRLSRRARIRARIKLTRSVDDDQFEVLEILAVP
ncbi:MAG: hypothetical protein QOG55_177 [Acidobacteriaceae bacterium]|jgi:hypothetical protein|nr:hypothetical protein [Acidobacteriaceae bacterium]MDQ1404548.1 hypothetical protein [Acidobacteriaceae bacterium]